MINDSSDDDRTRRRLKRHEPLPEGVYDFDANGPELTTEDEDILDRIWARIAAEKGRQADAELARGD